METLKSILTHKGDGIFHLECKSLNLAVTGKVPAPLLCRDICAKFPKLRDVGMVVYDTWGGEVSVVPSIGIYAEKSFGTNSPDKPDYVKWGVRA